MLAVHYFSAPKGHSLFVFALDNADPTEAGPCKWGVTDIGGVLTPIPK